MKLYVLIEESLVSDRVLRVYNNKEVAQRTADKLNARIPSCYRIFLVEEVVELFGRSKCDSAYELEQGSGERRFSYSNGESKE